MILKTKFSELLETCTFRAEAITIRINSFDEESAAKFSEEISHANSTGQTVIPVIIDSYGGEMDSLISMISDIESSQVPVSTVAVGKAMSCGSILLAFGAPGLRFIDKHSRLMIHEVAVGETGGKVADLNSMIGELSKSNDYIYGLMAKKCGKKSDYFIKHMRRRNNADWYLNAEDALKHGVVDMIGVPVLTRNVRVDYEYNLPSLKD